MPLAEPRYSGPLGFSDDLAVSMGIRSSGGAHTKEPFKRATKMRVN